MSTLRDQKKAKTREELIRVAMTLFLKNGYDATTIDQIAGAAGVGRRTFFRYFASKDLLLSSFQEGYVDQFRDAFRQTDPARKPIDRFTDAFRAVAKSLMASRDEILLMRQLVENSPSLTALDVALDQEIQAEVEVMLRECFADSTMPELEITIFAAALFAAYQVAFTQWIASNGKANFADLGRAAIAVVEKGAWARYLDE